jgi:hypothetical protein
MGYYLQAFICRQKDRECIKTKFDKAVSVDIGQGLSLIPMTEELFDQINNFEISPSIEDFEYLTENLESKILSVAENNLISYVEADYHGGEGGQRAIIWKDKNRQLLLGFGQERINQVLKYFGVAANQGEDEFLTMGFGLRRHTEEWLKDAN